MGWLQPPPRSPRPPKTGARSSRGVASPDRHRRIHDSSIPAGPPQQDREEIAALTIQLCWRKHTGRDAPATSGSGCVPSLYNIAYQACIILRTKPV